jgi:hypothetical protein
MSPPIRIAAIALAATAWLCAAPASAQMFWGPPELAGQPVTGAEPELGLNLPGATPTELRAGLVWHLRAALNVAALQCDFEPMLLTVSNYNAAIAHHKEELNNSFVTLGGYFQRVKGSGKPGQTALDQYGTRIYSSYSAVQAQRVFCQTAGSVGRDAIFADRGKLHQIAQKRLGEIRRALAGANGEQYFTNPAYAFRATLPSMSKSCWKKDSLTESCRAVWNKSRLAR